MSQYTETTQSLLDFIQKSPTSFHAAANLEAQFQAAGVEKLAEEAQWKLKCGSSYYVQRGDSALIAFHIPEGGYRNFQIVAAHSDSPMFKLKENPDMLTDQAYVKCNVERYGGMLCYPWFDRPLSVAGRVVVRTKEGLTVRLVNLDRDLLIIPSLAIHQDRKANEGHALQIQKELLPLAGEAASAGELRKQIADQAGVHPDDMLASDLFVYNRMPGTILGLQKEFFAAPRLDDLQCAYAAANAFLAAENPHSITMCCIFDHEEVGSGTIEGADSTFLSSVLERINENLGGSREKLYQALLSGLMLSADNAHAIHPNYPEKTDPVNHPHMNEGPVLKFHAAKKYTTDALSAAIFRELCSRNQIPCQTFVNHSDQPGGSTLGCISTGHVSMHALDIGCAQLSMHSPYETGGCKDTWYMIEAMKAFYRTPIFRNSNGNYELQDISLD